MIFHNSVQSYVRPVANVGIRQHLARRSTSELPGGIVLWKALGKVAVVVCVATITMSAVLSVYKGNVATAAAAVEQQRHELMDSNINLRAKRAALLSPQAIELAAGKMLSLYAPVNGQNVKL
jgi:hypothetical protein